MRLITRSLLLVGTSTCVCSPALAQNSANPTNPATVQTNNQDTAGRVAPGANQTANAQGEIIVTATKRGEAINDVPMSITAQTGAQLLAAGVTSPADLGKVVPGFTFTQSAYSTPVYSLRGIGFYNYDIGSTPTVTVYQDEFPLPFSSMTRGTSFDLERVEVLKGPQGLLFGENSTGGAINYIAARPTNVLRAGADGSYGRFNYNELGGFVSGPLGPGVSARLAVRHEGSGDWQNSTTRDARNGGRDLTVARAQLDAKLGSQLRARFGLNAFWDKSDVPGAQLIQVNPLIPFFVNPALLAQPLAHGNRDADWTVGTQPKRDDRQYQGTARLDYDFGDALTLTSLTSYADYRQNDRVDPDGTALRLADTIDTGSIKAFYQELRLSGELTNRSTWIVGANYEHNDVQETQILNASDASGFRFFNLVFGLPTPDDVPISSLQKFENKAVFGNIDYHLTDQLIAHAGVRYTDSRDRFTGCTGDSANGSLAAGLGIILAGDPTAFAGATCTQLDATLTPGAPTIDTLSEHNVSWRAGLDYKPNRDTLVYANVSRGFKAGAFPLIPATSFEQYRPVTQEQVTAYEAGVKLTPVPRVQLNGAVFYYDYKDKQVLGSVVLTPDIFGPLNQLVNIPKSTVYGGEIQLDVRPIDGLSLNAGATYVHSRIADFTNFDPFGSLVNFEGEAFPNTPEWQFSASADYQRPISSRLDAFVGTNITGRTSTNGALGEYDILKIDGYTLVDVRAGIASSDDRWRFTVWGRNIFNKYYWTNAYKIADISARFAGQPATFGASLSFRY